MGGKYSAEWWNKIAGISRETTASHDPSRVVDDLIQSHCQRQVGFSAEI